MAILNIANLLSDIQVNGGIPNDNRLIFTKDKHIITHGVDFLEDYDGTRGLVPSYSVVGNYGVLGKNGWTNLTTDFLPVNDNSVAANNLWSSQKIVNYFADGLAANDAMVFKGVLDHSGETPNSITNVPASDYSAGWTYRVAVGGTYGGLTCEAGDLIIALKDADTNQSTVNPAHWTVVQTNIEGTSTIVINGKTYYVYTKGIISDTMEFVAPTAVGSANDVLITDNNGKLTWVAQSALNAGKLGGVALGDLLTEVTATAGKISVTVGGTKKEVTAAGDWNINAATANKVNHVLKTEGNGLSSVEFDGSADKTISLLPATTTTLGGVKVGDHISVDNSGKIYLTKKNVEDALGKDVDSIASNVIVSTETQGLAPKIESATQMVGVDYYFLAYNPNNADKKEATWYTLPSNSLGNTWRPISINGTALFNDENTPTNVLNLVNGNLITITKDANSNNVIISTSAEVNQNAFSTIAIGTTNIAAKAKTDTVTFVGTNVTIEGTSANNTINFSVADFVGATATTAGKKGLTPAPAAGDHLKFLRGDGTWVTPTDTNTWRKIIVGGNNLGNEITTGDLTITGSNNIAVTLTNNTLNIASTYTPHVYDSGTGISKTTVNNTTTFALKAASTTELGGIKTGYSTSAANRKYAVQLDGDSKAFVEVPWTDTNIRDIKIGGKSIGSATLNIVPSSDVVISWDKNDSDFTDGEATISFGLSWYNINTEEYETA